MGKGGREDAGSAGGSAEATGLGIWRRGWPPGEYCEAAEWGPGSGDGAAGGVVWRAAADILKAATAVARARGVDGYGCRTCSGFLAGFGGS